MVGWLIGNKGLIVFEMIFKRKQRKHNEAVLFSRIDFVQQINAPLLFDLVSGSPLSKSRLGPELP